MLYLKELFYKLLLKLSPDDANVYVFYAFFLEGQQRQDEAEKLLRHYYDQYKEKAKQNFYLLNNLGFFALEAFKKNCEMTDLNFATTCLTEADKLQPKNERLLRNQIDLWIQWQTIYTAHNEKEPEYDFKIAMAWTILNDFVQAEARFWEAIDSTADDRLKLRYYLAYAWLMMKHNKHSQLLKLWDSRIFASEFLPKALEALRKAYPQESFDGLEKWIKSEGQELDLPKERGPSPEIAGVSEATVKDPPYPLLDEFFEGSCPADPLEYSGEPEESLPKDPNDSGKT